MAELSGMIAIGGAGLNFWSFAEGIPKGMTIHCIDPGIDTGDIIARKEVVFSPSGNETLSSTCKRLPDKVLGPFKADRAAIKAGPCSRAPQGSGGSFHRTKDRHDLSFLPAQLLLAFAAFSVLPVAAAERPSVSGPPKPLAAGKDGAGKSERLTIENIRVETGVANKVGSFFTLHPKCFSLVGKDRKLVCDFIDTGLARGIEQNISIESDLVFRIRIGRHLEPERKTRVLLDMCRGKDYDVEQLFVRRKNEYVLVIKPLGSKGRPRPAP